MRTKVWLLAVLAGISVVVWWSARDHQTLALQGDAQIQAGLASLSGKVEAPKPFKVAKIYARHLDKRVHFMVFTSRGEYRTMNMFPGDYEVIVRESGFSTEARRITVRGGEHATLDFSLQEAETAVMQRPGFVGSPRMTGWNRNDVKLVPYDDLYPPEPGREVVRKNCLRCHGLNFPPSRPLSAAQWSAAIDLMGQPNTEAREVETPPGTLTPDDRKTIVAYLTKHFGPGAAKRAVRLDLQALEVVLDEKALARAMYVEYALPLDPRLDSKNTVRNAGDVHLGREGNVWYTDQRRPMRVGRLDPRTGEFKDYVTPDAEATPHGLAFDEQGDVWWVENTGFHLGRLNPRTGKMVRYYMDPTGAVHGGHAHSTVIDSRQNVWFTVNVGNRLGKWGRQTETIALWELPTPHSQPIGIAVDRQDNIWVAELHGCNVARFDPRTERFTEYPAPSKPCTVGRVGADPRGSIWFGISSEAELVGLDPATGKMLDYRFPTPLSEPYDHVARRRGQRVDERCRIRRSPGPVRSAGEGIHVLSEPATCALLQGGTTREGAVWYGYGSETIQRSGVSCTPIWRS